MALAQRREPLAQRGGGRAGRRLGAEQLAEALDRADDVVEPLRLEPEQAQAGAPRADRARGWCCRAARRATRSGFSASSRSTSIRETSPIRGIACAAAGKSLLESTATIVGAAAGGEHELGQAGRERDDACRRALEAQLGPASSTATIGAACDLDRERRQQRERKPADRRCLGPHEHAT